MGFGIAGIGIGVVGAMGVALWFLGHQYLAEFEKRVNADTALKITQSTYEAEKKTQTALAKLDAQYQQRMKANEAEFNQRILELNTKLQHAQANAKRTPIQFGDDIITEFVRVDCLLALDPEREDYRANRQACRDGTAPAITTGKELFFAALEPSFWQAQGEACTNWDTFTGKEDRNDYIKENPWFDPSFCREVLVTMTPETAQYLTIFLERIEHYTYGLIEVAQQRGDIIEKLADNPIIPGENDSYEVVRKSKDDN